MMINEKALMGFEEIESELKGIKKSILGLFVGVLNVCKVFGIS